MMSPAPGGSTLTTSAPRSPRSWPANGPAMNAPSSSTRRPASGVSVTGRRVGSRPSRRFEVDFASSARTEELKAKLIEFDNEIVRPAEPIYRGQREESGNPHFAPPVMEELKVEARKRDLWNRFLPEPEHGPGLSNLEYAPRCEPMATQP